MARIHVWLMALMLGASAAVATAQPLLEADTGIADSPPAADTLAQRSSKTDANANANTNTNTNTNSIDNVDSAVDVTAGGNSSTPAAAPSVYDGTPYTWGISHSWYLPIGAAVDQTRFIGPVAKGSDLYVVADATSIGVLNATASGFRFNNTMNGGERFKRVGFSQPTIVTLSGKNGRFVGLWDARVGSSTARVDLADLVASDEPAADAGDQAEMPDNNNDDNDDDDTAYDVAFVYEEDADSPMFATLHAGRYVASFDVLGRRLWAHDLSQSFPDVLFSRLIIGREEYVAIGFDSHSTSTSSIHIHCMSITTGETTRSETIALGSPIYAPTLPGTVIVIGDPQNRWIVWRDVDHDLGLYSIEAGNARFMSEYIIGPGSEGFIVNNLVDLGSSDVFMRDFVMQLPSGDWIVRVSEHDSDEPHVSVISLHQVDNPTKILSHEYDTRYYVLVRLYLDTYGQMVVEHIDFETGQVVDAKVLLPTFPGNIVQAWVHFTFPEDHTDKEKGSRSALAPLWFIVGIDENGQYGMYDNADAYKLEFETPSVGDPAQPSQAAMPGSSTAQDDGKSNAGDDEDEDEEDSRVAHEYKPYDMAGDSELQAESVTDGGHGESDDGGKWTLPTAAESEDAKKPGSHGHGQAGHVGQTVAEPAPAPAPPAHDEL